MKLEGKVALVTGAASGIGKACALRLAQDGAKIVVADLNLPGAEDVAKEIQGITDAMAVSMDVTDEAQVDAGIEAAVNRFGSIDILVSNAGIQIVHPFEDYPFSEWKKMQAIHGDGAFLSSRAAYRKMKESGRGGKLIYMGSAHSHTGSKLKTAYCFAKHGLLGLARVLAKEGAEYGIHTYVICPGFVKTPLVEKQIPEQAKDLGITEEEVIKNVMLKDTVDGIFTTLEDVAGMVSACAQDSGAMTGQSFLVSHGWIMK